MLSAWVRSGASASISVAETRAASDGSSESGSGSSAVAGLSSGASTASSLAAASPAASDAAASSALPSRVILFADAIQPLLREKCGKCHLGEHPKGGLSVDQYAQLQEGGFNGAAIVAKDRQKSMLYTRVVLAASDDDHMPPPGEPQLSHDEIELVGAWIDQGAPAAAVAETAALSPGAERALLARSAEAGPRPPVVRGGGCGACSVPGSPRSQYFDAEAFLVVVAGFSSIRRRRRPARIRAN